MITADERSHLNSDKQRLGGKKCMRPRCLEMATTRLTVISEYAGWEDHHHFTVCPEHESTIRNLHVNCTEIIEQQVYQA